MAGAPIVPVSSMTRAGLDDLVALLDRLLQQERTRPTTGRSRLPIDRVFTIAGLRHGRDRDAARRRASGRPGGRDPAGRSAGQGARAPVAPPEGRPRAERHPRRRQPGRRRHRRPGARRGRHGTGLAAGDPAGRRQAPRAGGRAEAAGPQHAADVPHRRGRDDGEGVAAGSAADRAGRGRLGAASAGRRRGAGEGRPVHRAGALAERDDGRRHRGRAAPAPPPPPPGAGPGAAGRPGARHAGGDRAGAASAARADRLPVAGRAGGPLDRGDARGDRGRRSRRARSCRSTERTAARRGSSRTRCSPAEPAGSA